MAKDKGGHGSEKRGVSGVQARNDRMFAMFDRAKAQGHTGLYSGPTPKSGGGVFGKGDASEFAKRIGTGEPHDGAGAHSQGVQQVGQPPSADLKALNKTYDRNENNNFHSENIALLVKNFGTPAEHAQAKEIIAARNKQGYLTGSTKSVPNVHDWQYSIHQKYIGKLTGNRS